LSGAWRCALSNGTLSKSTIPTKKMADTDKLVEELSGLTVLEVADLVKSLEDKWGVSAAAPAAVAVAGGDAGEAVEEKTEFDVVLTSFGENKIAVIKEVRGSIDGLGLADAKKLVEEAPSTLKEAASKEEAEEIKAKLEGAGATIELK